MAALLAAGGLAPGRADEEYGRFQFDESDREHWSFMPVRLPDVPQVADAAWVRNPIDAFVLAALEEAGLQPAPPAEPRTLLRRVYLDLVGLPPMPGEQQAFLANPSPDALAKVIDDLLARPAYGERWGRHWLDVVRYAESNGYERDGAKPNAWRYRDYVIDSFNSDKPYDRFLAEQLAGDELDGSTAEMQIATTFLRLGPWDDEPADPEVDRYDQLDDVVGTTAATFLAQTLRCARCHDHKFESFTQRDYSRMLAVFEPLRRPQDGRTDLDRPVGTAQEVAAYREAMKQAEEKVAQLRRQIDRQEWSVCQRLASAGVLVPPAEIKPVLATSRDMPQSWRYTLEPPAADWVQAAFDDSDWPEGPGGFGTEGTPGSVVRTVWNTERIWLRRRFVLDPGQLPGLALVVHHDEDVEIYLNGVLAAQATGFTTDYQRLPISAEALAALQPGENLVAAHCRQSGGGQYLDVGLVAGGQPAADPPMADPKAELAAEAIAAFQTEPEKRSQEEQNLVKRFRPKLRGLFDKEAAPDEKATLEALERAVDEAEAARPTTPTMAYVWYEEGPRGPTTRVFRRGNPREPLEEVQPGFPAILVAAPPSLPAPTDHSSGRRRQLAEWLTRPDHPLTARVMVNRIWQHHFGDGIVGTENDFGVMGEAPTHPELLDWLAAEFVRGGWSIKRMHRLVMLSSTYQMSAAANDQAQRKDPHCELLWRWPPRRLEAEAVRDSILAASGQLNPQRGGPSVYPTIARAVLESQSRPGDGWGKSEPWQAARRSIYVFVKRTLVVPELEVLDFPDTNGTCEQRPVSTVAPQALTFLNGEFIHEQSRHFARRLMAEAADDPARVERAFLVAFCRPPSGVELAAVLDFLALQRRQLEADGGSAGQEPSDSTFAALEAFCLVLLNTNEFVYIR